MSKKCDRAWAEIDLRAISNNACYIRQLVGSSCQIAGVVKADAYGHGALAVSRVVLVEAGYDRLAVATVDEALELRRHGIKVPILVLGYTDPECLAESIKHNLTLSVFDWNTLTKYEHIARSYNSLLPIHLKIDTGMGRFGFDSNFGIASDLDRLKCLQALKLEAVFTHFANSDHTQIDLTEQQFKRFQSLCHRFKKHGIKFDFRHCCNSAALLRFPSMHLDMVRVGLINFGLLPDNCSDWKSALKPALQLKTKVVTVKQLASGSTIGYGSRYVTTCRQTIATIPIGYADGYSRIMSNRAEAIVHGQRVPVVGNICMDACMLDVSKIPDRVLPGDEVVLLGHQNYQQRQASIEANELATWQQTINYEVVSTIGKRVPRVYL